MRVTQTPNVKWNDKKDPVWAAKVLEVAGGFWKRGASGGEEWIEINVDCPRCGDPGTHGVIYKDVPVGLDVDKDPQWPKAKNVFCKCAEDHKAPPAKQGCGAWGSVAVIVAP
jgi:hypothetical protein